jgi:ABC-type nitrate/sulfonate/bicarbonate transport system substrate-binding protein
VDFLKAVSLVIFVFLMALPKAEAKKVKLFLKWDHQFQFAGYYAAKEKGIFKKYGLEVEFVSRIKDEKNLYGLYELINADQVEFSVGGPDVLVQNASGAELMVVATVFQNSPFGFFSPEESKITHPSEVVGKRVMASNGDFSIFELNALLISVGIQNEENYTLVPIDFSPLSLFSGKADLKANYVLSELWAIKDQERQFHFFRSSDFGLNMYGDTLVTKRSLALKDPELVEKFRQASVEGWVYALEHPEEVSRMIVEKYPEIREKYDDDFGFNMHSYEIIKELMYYPNVEVGHSSPQRWAQIVDQLIKIGLLKEPQDIQELVFDYSYIKEQKRKSLAKVWLAVGLSLAAVVLVLLVRFLFTRRELTNQLNEY